MMTFRKLFTGAITFALIGIAVQVGIQSTAGASLVTVTLMENASPSDATSNYFIVSTTAAGSTQVQIPSIASEGFIKQSSTFAGWATSTNGSAIYPDRGLLTLTSESTDFTLYAVWQSQSVPHTLSLYRNSSSSDPTSAPQVASVPTGIELISQLNWVDPGYSFAGWSLNPTGSIIYVDGATYQFNLDISLYAIWVPSQFTVTFNSEGGNPLGDVVFQNGGAGLVLPAATQSGYEFDGWFTQPNGGTFVGGAGVSYTPTQAITLYAQWTQSQFEVVFNADGGSVSPTSVLYSVGGADITLPSASLTGNSLSGWYSAALGGQLIGSSGSLFVPTANVTLYAQWDPLPNVEVILQGNGGTISVGTLSGQVGTVVNLPTAATSVRPGYVLTEWTTESAGGTIYQPGQALTLSDSETLYAQWAAVDIAVQWGVIAFPSSTTSLTVSATKQILQLVTSIVGNHDTAVILTGVTSNTGSASRNLQRSLGYAQSVQRALVTALNRNHVVGVHVTSQGASTSRGRVGGQVTVMIR
jgi:uncharacterized repeat protein (TIGR02543 family)